MFGKIKDVLSLDKLIENFEGYLDARIELVKYDLKELMVSVLTRSLIFLAMAVFGLAGLLCLNFALANLLNYLFENQFAGYFILSGIYFLITLVFYLNRENQSLKDKIELSLRQSMNQPKQESTSSENENAD
jgi:hypothetical protein